MPDQKMAPTRLANGAHPSTATQSGETKGEAPTRLANEARDEGSHFDEDRHHAPSSTQPDPSSLMYFDNRIEESEEQARSRPVGTGGGGEEGMGPCACPGGECRDAGKHEANTSHVKKDRHQAPTATPPLPLSLQNARVASGLSLPFSFGNIHQEAAELSGDAEREPGQEVETRALLQGERKGKEAQRPRRRIPLSFIIGGLAILGAVIYLVYANTQANAVYYMTVTELKSCTTCTTQSVRVAGIVQQGSIVKDDQKQVISFVITQGKLALPVTYSGVVPDIFRPGIEVVVEGHYTGQGPFTAQTLLAKCPSKFQAATPAP